MRRLFSALAVEVAAAGAIVKARKLRRDLREKLGKGAALALCERAVERARSGVPLDVACRGLTPREREVVAGEVRHA